MATVTAFITGTQTTEHVDSYVMRAKNTIDFSSTNASAADVVQALKIPAGAFVTQVITNVRTAEGGACTGDVGVTGDDANGFNDALDMNSTGVESGAPGTDAYLTAGGKYFASADTIDIVLDHNADAAILDIIAIYFMV